jgi:hypothetical protein
MNRAVNFTLKAWSFIISSGISGAYMPPLIFFGAAGRPLGIPEVWEVMEALAGGMP